MEIDKTPIETGIEMSPIRESGASVQSEVASKSFAEVSAVLPQRRFTLPSIPSVSEFFTYMTTPKQVTLRAFTVSNANEFRGNRDDARAVLNQLSGIEIREGETLVLKRGYLRNYFQSQPLNAVSAAERKSTMSYLFSVAKNASPRTPHLDIALVFGTERTKEDPVLSQSYLTKIRTALPDDSERGEQLLQEATSEDATGALEVMAKLPSNVVWFVDADLNLEASRNKLARDLQIPLGALGKIEQPPPRWEKRCKSITVQSPDPRSTNPVITVISKEDKARIVSAVDESGKSAAIFYVSGSHAYSFKTTRGSGSGGGTYKSLYYVPKEKVGFFLDAFGEISMSELDFIATV